MLKLHSTKNKFAKRNRYQPDSVSLRQSSNTEGNNELPNSNGEAEESAVSFHRVTDPFKITELEQGPKVKVYRAMQLIDGKLYPPMSTKTDGKLRESLQTAKNWQRSIIVKDDPTIKKESEGTAFVHA